MNIRISAFVKQHLIITETAAAKLPFPVQILKRAAVQAKKSCTAAAFLYKTFNSYYESEKSSSTEYIEQKVIYAAVS